jgi:pyridoxamine 5'-phosphate oxidase
MSDQSVQSEFYDEGERLPDLLPDSPFPIFSEWFDQALAEKHTPNPNSMTITTIHSDGMPDARVVLCKLIDQDPGSVVFYTNYNGAKGRQLAAIPFVSASFHWDHYERQVRVRGPVIKATEAESDAYFASRRLESRLGSWISDQSQPIESRDALLEKVGGVMEKLGLDAAALMNGEDIVIPRPPHWGGYRIHAQSVELWAGGVGRIHDRARWNRELTKDGNGYTYGPWSSTRLQP